MLALLLQTLAAALLLAAMQRFKFRDFEGEVRLPARDLAALVVVELALGLVPLWPVSTLLGAALFTALWLDAVLFRVFTIELGLAAVFDLVPRELLRELKGYGRARRVLGSKAWFFAVPPVALLAHTRASLQLGVTLALVALALWFASRQRADEPEAPVVSRSGLLLPFLLGRKRRVPSGFQPRAEDAVVLEVEPAAPVASLRHGAARSADLVLVTVESLGRHAGAAMPWLKSLSARGLASERHFCVTALTTPAHAALYASAHVLAEASNVRALGDAGYQTVYLTSADVAHYGLAPLLQRAGFEHVLDARRLPTGRSPDHALVEAGPALVAALRDGRPLFLHVQTSNSHLPYVVGEPERFDRLSLEDDLGRYRASLAEADALLAGFDQALRRDALRGEPVLCVTGDHGQAFGERGYFSHGCSVVAPAIEVPCALAHASLQPGTVARSSHFDVLPTLMDLAGVAAPPGLGQSLLAPPRELPLVLSAGNPSRAETSHFGLVLGPRKLTVDLATGRCYASALDDSAARLLTGGEASYAAALVTAAFERTGLP